MTSIKLLLLFLLCSASVISARRAHIKKCHILAKNAKVNHVKPRVIKITCLSGYAASTGKTEIWVRCLKPLKTKLNLCHKRESRIQRPYPLFQSDDPHVDDNIVLLDNEDDLNKKKGVYILQDRDSDNYEDQDYDYNDYEEGKDYGSYYDYDYDKAADYDYDENYEYPEEVDDVI